MKELKLYILADSVKPTISVSNFSVFVILSKSSDATVLKTPSF